MCAHLKSDRNRLPFERCHFYIMVEKQSQYTQGGTNSNVRLIWLEKNKKNDKQQLAMQHSHHPVLAGVGPSGRP